MKNKTKKILAGACLGLMGMGLISGCSMTDEQMDALNVITENTQTLVESFESYLEGEKNKIDKEIAYDMLKQARLKSQYIFDESSICEINIEMTLESQKETQKATMLYDYSTDIKKTFVKQGQEGEEYLVKYNIDDEDNSYSVDFAGGQIQLKKMDESKNLHIQNIGVNLDALAQAEITTINIENIARVSVNEEGEYTFNIISTNMYYSSDEDKYMQVVNFVEVVVKDYLLKSVSVQQIQKEGYESSFEKDVDGNRISDGYGSYVFYGNVVDFLTLNAEYKYGEDVALDSINSKIADIDAKIKSGELTFDD